MNRQYIEGLRERLEEFLKELIRTGRFKLRFQIRPADEADSETRLLVDWSGEDTDLLLARKGEMLRAMEYLAGRALRLSQEEQRLILFDSGDFREMLIEEIRMMAETAADKVESTGMPFAMGPMNSHDRRQVHLSLRDRPGVRTESEGGGPGRKVVIYPSS